MSFEGKNIIMTGAGSRGILYEAAKGFLAKGASKIAILDIVDATDAVEDLKTSFPGKEIRAITTDVSDRSQVEAAFKQVSDSWKQIDICLSGSAVMNEHEIEKTVQVNFLGVIYTTLTAIEYMSKSKGGNGGMIVTVSSLSGLEAPAPIPITASTKHATIGFTRCFANDLYYNLTGIKFVIVCPGVTDTLLLSSFTGSLYEETMDAINVEFESLPTQTTEDAGQKLVEVLENSENGSTWIIDSGKSWPVNFTVYYEH